LYAKQPLLILVAMLIAVIGMLLGIFILCIGIIFTVPYLYAMHYTLYAQAVGFEERTNVSENQSE
jgi:predicted ferric reductase